MVECSFLWDDCAAKGACCTCVKSVDLPIAPAKFELAINLKAAEAFVIIQTNYLLA
jgi:hypothetical protein